MKFSYDLSGAQNQIIKEFTVYGSTLSRDSLVMRGVTSGTNQGGVIVASGAFTDVLGVVTESIPQINSTLNAPSYVENETPSVQSTGVVLLHKVCINPFAVYRVEYSQATADTFTGTMTSSGKTITCASLEDLTGGFIYNVTTGDLLNVSAGSGLTLLSTPSVAITSAHYVLKIQPNLGKLLDLNTVSTMIGGTGQSQAAAGSGVVTVLDTYVQADTIPLTKLLPAVHSGLNLLGKNPKFFADIIFPKHVALHQS